MDSVREEFRRYLLRDPSGDEMRDCVACLSSRNVSVRDMVIGTAAYGAAVRSAVQRQHIKATGARWDSFRFEQFRDFAGGLPLTEELAREFVGRSDAVREHRRALVLRVLGEMDAALPDSTVDGFVERMARDPEYGEDSLRRDVESGRLPRQALACAILLECGGEGEGAEGEGEAAEGEGAEAGAAAAPDAARAALDYIDAWEAATGQEMTPYELARFSREIPARDAGAMAEARRALDAAYSECARLVSEYTGEAYPRRSFLRSWVTQFDAPGFEVRFLAELLAGEAYRREMVAVIARTYVRLFGTAIHADDAEHCLERCLAERLPLGSELVQDIAVDCRNDVQDMRDRLGEAYQRVLKRDADEDEVREFVARCRETSTPAALQAAEARLYGSLEFHDVIKRGIAEWHANSFGGEIKRRLLYEILDRVLDTHASDLRAWRVPDEFSPAPV